MFNSIRMEFPYIDFHTHNHTQNDDVLSVSSLDVRDDIYLSKGFFTSGIHPWSVNLKTAKDDLLHIESRAQESNMLAIGEVGLDKLRGPSLSIQQDIFLKQIEIAQKYNKPTVIHCVKAWEQLVKIRKDYSTSLPWAIHGFNGSVELGKQLVEKGFYLSFGVNLLGPNSKVTHVLKSIPHNRIFLETDESEVSVTEIYKSAVNILGISISELKAITIQNFKIFFGIDSVSKPI